MILFKNVDINDLISITEKGIIPLDECEFNNWEDGKRADNRTDVVYLFDAIEPTKKNSFINYGLVLLKVDVDSATENELSSCDVNKGKYIEYITDRVAPEQIKDIYIPKCFKQRILTLNNEDRILPDSPITWCDITISEWNKPFTSDRLERFVKTAPLSTLQPNYLRGIDENRRMIDLNKDNVFYNI